MNVRRGLRLALPLGISALFLSRLLVKDARLFTAIANDRVLNAIASVCKLVALLGGAIAGWVSARSFDDRSVIRSAWGLTAAWLACFFTGQLVLSFYEDLIGLTPPVPSAGDLFFLVGYVFAIAAVIRFIQAYRASGFPLGQARDHLLVALGVTVLFALVGVRVLVPMVLAPEPILRRCLNVGYPLLDFILVCPTLVLLRITLPFRGGRVWAIWAALLAGIAFFTSGDVLSADVTPLAAEGVPTLVHLLFILGYGYCGYGAFLQYELVAAENAA